MRAAIFDGTAVQVVDDLTVRDPGPGEMRVRVQASGMCQSDLSVVSGKIPFPVPVVMGHEGAGTVEEIGIGVTHVQPGDHVVLSTLTSCGTCQHCSMGSPTMCRKTFGNVDAPFDLRGMPINAYARVSTFSEYVVVNAAQAVPIPKSVPFDVAGIVGCCVLTGVGAVLNRARVQIGDTVCVIGGGGIGLNVVQGARLAKAARIIAVDANPDKEAVARAFGATDFIEAGSLDTVQAVKDLTNGEGVDHAFECVGHPELQRQSIDMLGWHGQAVLLGMTGSSAEVSFPAVSLYLDKSVLGCRYGSSRPAADIPRYLELYQSGQLMLDELVSRKYELDAIHELMADVKNGRLNRGVLKMGPEA